MRFVNLVAPEYKLQPHLVLAVIAPAVPVGGIVQVRDLTVSHGPQVVLRHIAFEIQPREVFVILGASGSGKSSVLAAIAGVMWAANYGTVQHSMGFLPGLKAFTAAVFGGIGNLAGAVVGGILLGLIESIGAGYIGDLTGGVLGSHYADIFAFVVLIVVLTLRPSGLLGERVADRA